MTSSANPSGLQQTATFTATVTPVSPGGGVPTGTVTFFDGTQVLGTGTLVSPGVWTLATAALPPGPQSITFSYSGDANFAGSTSVAFSQSVLAPSDTEVVPSMTVLTIGEPLTLVATVTAPASTGTPTGTITFVDVTTASGTGVTPSVRTNAIVSAIAFNGGTVLGTASLNSGGVATLSVSSLPPGLNMIFAYYGGDSTHFASSSLVADVAINGLTQVTDVTRYGFHAQPTFVLLSFNSPLDATTAENPLNYRIVGPAGRRIAVVKAIYDPATDTVTLVPAERLNIHQRYGLTVIGASPAGVMNSSGQPLDGAANGQAAGNYVTSLTWRNLRGRASALPTRHLLQEARTQAARVKTASHHAAWTLHTAAVDHLLASGSFRIR